MGQVFQRTILWEKELREIARQQFNDLDSDDQDEFDSALQDVRKIKGKNQKHWKTKKRKSEFKRGPMSFLDVEGLIHSYKNLVKEMRKSYPRMYPVLTNDTIVQYMKYICDYVNKSRRRNGQSSESSETSEGSGGSGGSGGSEGSEGSESSESCESEEQPRRKPKARKAKMASIYGQAAPPSVSSARTPATAAEDSPSCVFVSTENFEQINPGNDSWIDGLDLLKQMGCDGEKFMNLDFFFILYHNPNLGEHGHYSLLGIAPKQHFVFAINSLEQTNWHYKRWPLSGVWDILLSQISERGKKAKNAWPVFGEWSVKQDQKKKNNCPNCARQGDLYNCGVFTLTNAMCLAFGYDLMCYSNRDLDSLKRPRMFMELSNTTIDDDKVKTGFKDEYAYDLLELAAGPLYFTRRGLSARRVVRNDQAFFDEDDEDQNENENEDGNNEDEDDEDTDEDKLVVYEEDSDSDDTYVPKEDDYGDDEDEDEDDENDSDLSEQYRMVNDPDETHSDDHEASPAPVTPRTLSKEMGVAIEAVMVADFMQRIPERFGAWKNNKKYVRESELENRAFLPQFDPLYFRKAGAFYTPIEVPGPDPPPRFTIDRTEKRAVFAYWREQNVIAACGETFWSDDVKPFDGMIDGFQEWLEENPPMGVGLELSRWEIGLGESKPVTDISSRSQFVQDIRMKMRNSLANLK
ncbi:hypothetical protein DL98DRAFT_589364 [Cadophora sp. DSE1049]|nr:hypothetical protein DL98DRAFT_589364 [Cadophora sp. DSE1049]